MTGALPSGQDRDALVAEVCRALDEVLSEASRVVLAVSGGPDSTALAYLVTEARPDLEAHVAHVRHGLRDDAEDAAVAAAHADALGLAFQERSVEVVPAGQGIEAAARAARYAALARIARAVDARAILVGHTADDQAETVLMNLARGAGLRGLTGMATARSEAGDGPDPHDSVVEAAYGLRVCRPLLRLRRDDVRGFLTGEGLQAVSDPTNRDLDRRRARARYEVLPALATLSGGDGDPVGALTRLADLAREDADALDELAAGHARRVVVAWGPGRAVRRAELDELPRALAARVVRLALRAVRGTTELPASTTAAVLDLASGDALHTPGGVWVTCGGGWLAAAPPDREPLPERPLATPGATAVPELDVVVHADLGGPEPAQRRLRVDLPVSHSPPDELLAPAPPGADRAAWAVVSVPPRARLVVRSRRPGDRLGQERLTDALSAAGVPRALRDLVPVVATVDGEVMWVPGLPAAGVRPDAGPDEPPGSGALRLWLAPAATPEPPAGARTGSAPG